MTTLPAPGATVTSKLFDKPVSVPLEFVTVITSPVFSCEIVTLSVQLPEEKFPLTVGVTVPVKSEMSTVPLNIKTVTPLASFAVTVIGKATPTF